MSMWLNLAKLSPSTFEKAKKTPSLVEALFFAADKGAASPADFDGEADVYGEDYRTISAVVEAMGEAGVEHEWLDKAMGGDGEELAYEFCYGPGFALAPPEVKTIAKELGKDPDGFGIAEFFAEAAKQGKGIIGGVS